MLAGRAASDHDFFEKLKLLQYWFDGGQQRVGDKQDLGAAVIQDAEILVGSEQCIERDGHDAGLDRAPEHGRKVDCVKHDLCDPGFAFEAKAMEQVRRTVHACGKLFVGIAVGVIDDRDLVAPSFGQVPVDHVRRGIVAALILGHFSLPPSVMTPRQFCPLKCNIRNHNFNVQAVEGGTVGAEL